MGENILVVEYDAFKQIINMSLEKDIYLSKENDSYVVTTTPNEEYLNGRLTVKSFNGSCYLVAVLDFENGLLQDFTVIKSSADNNVTSSIVTNEEGGMLC